MAQVQARTVLWHLVFIGFAVNYMIRINLNITIVEMIVAKEKTSLAPQSSPPAAPGRIAAQLIEAGASNVSDVAINTAGIVASGLICNGCKNHSSIISSIIEVTSSSSYRSDFQHELSTTNEKKYSLEKHILDWANIEYESSGFHWNEYKQGLVLGSFFWAHWITQIPGGILAKKYGTKLVFGLSNAIGCWMCFFIPIVSYWDFRALIWLRVIQGLITGLAWPAMHVMTAQWIPPNERSKFVTAYLGSSIGIALCYPLFGYVIYWTSWEWVYHICGIIGTLWWLGWLFFVYDTPAQHPRISDSEVRYIEKSQGASVQNANHGPTPWRQILLSRPVWMNVIAQWGGIWGLFTMMTQAPTYFRVIHNWNIRATGLLSGLPHLLRVVFAYVFSILADYLLHTEKMSRTNLRKLATAVCCIVNGMLVLALAYFGHNATAAIVFLTSATMVHGAVSSGPLASIVDIAPNYAGIVLGISGMIGVLPGFISPWWVGILTLGNQTYEAWKLVFLICAAMLIGSGVIFVLFAESTLQSWNSSQPKHVHDVLSELELLHEKKPAATIDDGKVEKQSFGEVATKKQKGDERL